MVTTQDESVETEAGHSQTGTGSPEPARADAAGHGTRMTGAAPGEFLGEFLPALPEQYRAALNADNVSTPFYLARRAGWSTEQLVGDAFHALKRGGVGLVVTRLKELAKHPVKQADVERVTRKRRVTPDYLPATPLPECEGCGQPYRTIPKRDMACVSCGEPLVLRVHSVNG